MAQSVEKHILEEEETYKAIVRSFYPDPASRQCITRFFHFETIGTYLRSIGISASDQEIMQALERFAKKTEECNPNIFEVLLKRYGNMGAELKISVDFCAPDLWVIRPQNQ